MRRIRRLRAHPQTGLAVTRMRCSRISSCSTLCQVCQRRPTEKSIVDNANVTMPIKRLITAAVDIGVERVAHLGLNFPAAPCKRCSTVQRTLQQIFRSDARCIATLDTGLALGPRNFIFLYINYSVRLAPFFLSHFHL